MTSETMLNILAKRESKDLPENEEEFKRLSLLRLFGYATSGKDLKPHSENYKPGMDALFLNDKDFKSSYMEHMETYHDHFKKGASCQG